MKESTRQGGRSGGRALPRRDQPQLSGSTQRPVWELHAFPGLAHSRGEEAGGVTGEISALPPHPAPPPLGNFLVPRTLGAGRAEERQKEAGTGSTTGRELPLSRGTWAQEGSPGKEADGRCWGALGPRWEAGEGEKAKGMCGQECPWGDGAPASQRRAGVGLAVPGQAESWGARFDRFPEPEAPPAQAR